jgi:hypothetical protein
VAEARTDLLRVFGAWKPLPEEQSERGEWRAHPLDVMAGNRLQHRKGWRVVNFRNRLYNHDHS